MKRKPALNLESGRGKLSSTSFPRDPATVAFMTLSCTAFDGQDHKAVIFSPISDDV